MSLEILIEETALGDPRRHFGLEIRDYSINKTHKISTHRNSTGDRLMLDILYLYIKGGKL